jgi:hypothetical protein
MAALYHEKYRPRKPCWAASKGGNRLSQLHQLLVADRNHLDSLAEDDPRRRPTMPRLAWLELVLENEEGRS